MLTPEFETASWARRIFALFVDWIVSTFFVIALVGWDTYFEIGGNAQTYVIPTYVVETALFTWLLGGSFGKLATRLRVVPDSGPVRPHNPLRILARQVMIVLVIPPLVFRPDGRGLHDLFARTATVTLDTYRSLRGPAGP